MAFLIHSTDDGRAPAIEYLPCGAIAPKVGMAMVQTSGNLMIATGSSAPTYISMCEKDSACTAGEMIPVIRVQPDIIFETTNSEDFAGIKHGDKVALHASSGLQVTAATDGGAAEVIGFDGTAVGSRVRVRFN